MYIVGIVGRAYYNKDNNKIIQTHESTRRFLAKEKEIVCITLLPDNDDNYIDIEPGKDKVDSNKIDYILDCSNLDNITQKCKIINTSKKCLQKLQ